MNYHLIGIGGVGMSALATLLLRQGHSVSGSDRNIFSPNVESLRARGIAIFPDDGSGIDDNVDEVVVSTAIESGNPAFLAAKEKGKRIVHRASALSNALSAKKLVAVAGTCGKSSVTALLGHILAECGMDPLCVNGANVVGWDGAVRFGDGDYAVAEVDESDKSLVSFKPYAAIITNASADHYSKEEMDEVFDVFIKDVPGPVIDARGEIYAADEFTEQNESLAVRMAVRLGCPEEAALKAVRSFSGVERRLQRYGSKVYDDYAHNPEKLRSMIATLKKRHGGPICVIWRPHGYGPLKKMLAELSAVFGENLSSSDKLLLLPVYDAGGTADRSINVEALQKALPAGLAEIVATHEEALFWCKENGGGFSAIVTAGARDVFLPKLAAAVADAIEV